MDITSFPSFPPPVPSKSDVAESSKEWTFTRRQKRMLTDLLLSVFMVMMVVWIKQITNTNHTPTPIPQPQQPVTFEEIQKRLGKINLLSTLQEVEELFGPPTQIIGWGERMSKWELDAEQSNRHLGLPQPRMWQLWIDPSNEERWIAVLFADGRVYWKRKQGF